MRAVLAVLLLGGCSLVDQTTFNADAGKAPVIPEAPKPVAAAVPAGPPPLVTIPPGSQGYESALRSAVATARARKADVVFDVVEVQAPDAAAESGLGRAAGDVGRTIVGAGVPAARVRLALRPDAAGRPGEVRVYVR